MITISESGMVFGPFDETQVYHIEKSRLYNGINNVKTVEFILELGGQTLQFVEAKSSSPRPTPDNNVDFDDFIVEISEKFLHSLNLYYSAILKRHEETNDIPNGFEKLNNENLSIKFLLVIKGHKIDWLPPICDALNRKMISYESIWNFEIAVINDDMALKRRLIS